MVETRGIDNSQNLNWNPSLYRGREPVRLDLAKFIKNLPSDKKALVVKELESFLSDIEIRFSPLGEFADLFIKKEQNGMVRFEKLSSQTSSIRNLKNQKLRELLVVLGYLKQNATDVEFRLALAKLLPSSKRFAPLANELLLRRALASRKFNEQQLKDFRAGLSNIEIYFSMDKRSKIEKIVIVKKAVSPNKKEYAQIEVLSIYEVKKPQAQYLKEIEYFQILLMGMGLLTKYTRKGYIDKNTVEALQSFYLSNPSLINLKPQQAYDTLKFLSQNLAIREIQYHKLFVDRKKIEGTKKGSEKKAEGAGVTEWEKAIYQEIEYARQLWSAYVNYYEQLEQYLRSIPAGVEDKSLAVVRKYCLSEKARLLSNIRKLAQRLFGAEDEKIGGYYSYRLKCYAARRKFILKEIADNKSEDKLIALRLSQVLLSQNIAADAQFLKTLVFEEYLPLSLRRACKSLFEKYRAYLSDANLQGQEYLFSSPAIFKQQFDSALENLSKWRNKIEACKNEAQKSEYALKHLKNYQKLLLQLSLAKQIQRREWKNIAFNQLESRLASIQSQLFVYILNQKWGLKNKVLGKFMAYCEGRIKDILQQIEKGKIRSTRLKLVFQYLFLAAQYISILGNIKNAVRDSSLPDRTKSSVQKYLEVKSKKYSGNIENILKRISYLKSDKCGIKYVLEHMENKKAEAVFSFLTILQLKFFLSLRTEQGLEDYQKKITGLIDNCYVILEAQPSLLKYSPFISSEVNLLASVSGEVNFRGPQKAKTEESLKKMYETVYQITRTMKNSYFSQVVIQILHHYFSQKVRTLSPSAIFKSYLSWVAACSRGGYSYPTDIGSWNLKNSAAEMIGKKGEKEPPYFATKDLQMFFFGRDKASEASRNEVFNLIGFFYSAIKNYNHYAKLKKLPAISFVAVAKMALAIIKIVEGKTNPEVLKILEILSNSPIRDELAYYHASRKLEQDLTRLKLEQIKYIKTLGSGFITRAQGIVVSPRFLGKMEQRYIEGNIIPYIFRFQDILVYSPVVHNEVFIQEKFVTGNRKFQKDPRLILYAFLKYSKNIGKPIQINGAAILVTDALLKEARNFLLTGRVQKVSLFEDFLALTMKPYDPQKVEDQNMLSALLKFIKDRKDKDLIGFEEEISKAALNFSGVYFVFDKENNARWLDPKFALQNPDLISERGILLGQLRYRDIATFVRRHGLAAIKLALAQYNGKISGLLRLRMTGEVEEKMEAQDLRSVAKIFAAAPFYRFNGGAFNFEVEDPKILRFIAQLSNLFGKKASFYQQLIEKLLDYSQSKFTKEEILGLAELASIILKNKEQIIKNLGNKIYKVDLGLRITALHQILVRGIREIAFKDGITQKEAKLIKTFARILELNGLYITNHLLLVTAAPESDLGRISNPSHKEIYKTLYPKVMEILKRIHFHLYSLAEKGQHEIKRKGYPRGILSSFWSGYWDLLQVSWKAAKEVLNPPALRDFSAIGMQPEVLMNLRLLINPKVSTELREITQKLEARQKAIYAQLKTPAAKIVFVNWQKEHGEIVLLEKQLISLLKNLKDNKKTEKMGLVSALLREIEVLTSLLENTSEYNLHLFAIADRYGQVLVNIYRLMAKFKDMEIHAIAKDKKDPTLLSATIEKLLIRSYQNLKELLNLRAQLIPIERERQKLANRHAEIVALLTNPVFTASDYQQLRAVLWSQFKSQKFSRGVVSGLMQYAVDFFGPLFSGQTNEVLNIDGRPFKKFCQILDDYFLRQKRNLPLTSLNPHPGENLEITYVKLAFAKLASILPQQIRFNLLATLPVALVGRHGVLEGVINVKRDAMAAFGQLSGIGNVVVGPEDLASFKHYLNSSLAQAKYHMASWLGLNSTNSPPQNLAAYLHNILVNSDDGAEHIKKLYLRYKAGRFLVDRVTQGDIKRLNDYLIKHVFTKIEHSPRLLARLLFLANRGKIKTPLFKKDSKGNWQLDKNAFTEALVRLSKIGGLNTQVFGFYESLNVSYGQFDPYKEDLSKLGQLIMDILAVQGEISRSNLAIDHKNTPLTYFDPGLFLQDITNANAKPNYITVVDFRGAVARRSVTDLSSGKSYFFKLWQKHLAESWLFAGLGDKADLYNQLAPLIQKDLEKLAKDFWKRRLLRKGTMPVEVAAKTLYEMGVGYIESYVKFTVLMAKGIKMGFVGSTQCLVNLLRAVYHTSLSGDKRKLSEAIEKLSESFGHVIGAFSVFELAGFLFIDEVFNKINEGKYARALGVLLAISEMLKHGSHASRFLLSNVYKKGTNVYRYFRYRGMLNPRFAYPFPQSVKHGTGLKLLFKVAGAPIYWPIHFFREGYIRHPLIGLNKEIGKPVLDFAQGIAGQRDFVIQIEVQSPNVIETPQTTGVLPPTPQVGNVRRAARAVKHFYYRFRLEKSGLSAYVWGRFQLRNEISFFAPRHLLAQFSRLFPNSIHGLNTPLAPQNLAQIQGFMSFLQQNPNARFKISFTYDGANKTYRINNVNGNLSPEKTYLPRKLVEGIFGQNQEWKSIVENPNGKILILKENAIQLIDRLGVDDNIKGQLKQAVKQIQSSRFVNPQLQPMSFDAQTLSRIMARVVQGDYKGFIDIVRQYNRDEGANFGRIKGSIRALYNGFRLMLEEQAVALEKAREQAASQPEQTHKKGQLLLEHENKIKNTLGDERARRIFDDKGRLKEAEFEKMIQEQSNKKIAHNWEKLLIKWRHFYAQDKAMELNNHRVYRWALGQDHAKQYMLQIQTHPTKPNNPFVLDPTKPAQSEAVTLNARQIINICQDAKNNFGKLFHYWDKVQKYTDLVGLYPEGTPKRAKFQARLDKWINRLSVEFGGMTYGQANGVFAAARLDFMNAGGTEQGFAKAIKYASKWNVRIAMSMPPSAASEPTPTQPAPQPKPAESPTGIPSSQPQVVDRRGVFDYYGKLAYLSSEDKRALKGDVEKILTQAGKSLESGQRILFYCTDTEINFFIYKKVRGRYIVYEWDGTRETAKIFKSQGEFYSYLKGKTEINPGLTSGIVVQKRYPGMRVAGLKLVLKAKARQLKYSWQIRNFQKIQALAKRYKIQIHDQKSLKKISQRGFRDLYRFLADNPQINYSAIMENKNFQKWLIGTRSGRMALKALNGQLPKSQAAFSTFGGIVVGMAVALGAEKAAYILGIKNPCARFVFVLACGHAAMVASRSVVTLEGLCNLFIRANLAYSTGQMSLLTRRRAVLPAEGHWTKRWGMGALNIVKGLGYGMYVSNAYGRLLDNIGVDQKSWLRSHYASLGVAIAAPAIGQGVLHYVEKVGYKTILGSATKLIGRAFGIAAWGALAIDVGSSFLISDYRKSFLQRLVDKVRVGLIKDAEANSSNLQWALTFGADAIFSTSDLFLGHFSRWVFEKLNTSMDHLVKPAIKEILVEDIRLAKEANKTMASMFSMLLAIAQKARVRKSGLDQLLSQKVVLTTEEQEKFNRYDKLRKMFTNEDAINGWVKLYQAGRITKEELASRTRKLLAMAQRNFSDEKSLMREIAVRLNMPEKVLYNLILKQLASRFQEALAANKKAQETMHYYAAKIQMPFSGSSMLAFANADGTLKSGSFEKLSFAVQEVFNKQAAHRLALQYKKNPHNPAFKVLRTNLRLRLWKKLGTREEIAIRRQLVILGDDFKWLARAQKGNLTYLKNIARCQARMIIMKTRFEAALTKLNEASKREANMLKNSDPNLRQKLQAIQNKYGPQMIGLMMRYRMDLSANNLLRLASLGDVKKAGRS